ncbi:terminase, partial [Salmonid herpesvirus 2]
ATRGQTPDFILVDEAAFVNLTSITSLIPLMLVAGRKQIHISSHVAKSWMNNVGDIIDEATGEPAFHVISQKFKCAAHMHLPSLTCPCEAVYCPSHIDMNPATQALLSCVAPGGEMEITGGTGDLGDLVSETITPFTTETIHKIMNNVVDITDPKTEVSAFYIAIDPTYSSGSLSSL